MLIIFDERNTQFGSGLLCKTLQVAETAVSVISLANHSTYQILGCVKNLPEEPTCFFTMLALKKPLASGLCVSYIVEICVTVFRKKLAEQVFTVFGSNAVLTEE